MKKHNKPLTEKQLNKIEKEFNKFNIKTDLYKEYLSKNNIPKGKARHHIFPISIFGENNIIYNTSLKWHTRLHLLLIADNLKEIKSNQNLSKELCDVILGGTVRYAFGYKKFLNSNADFEIKDSWFLSMI